jgi:hypothetical protein
MKKSFRGRKIFWIILNVKIFNYKVSNLVEHCNFDIEPVSIQGRLKNSKSNNIIYIFEILNNLKNFYQL